MRGYSSGYSPGERWPSDIRLQRGTLKEREAEARRQGVFECWETKVRREQEEREGPNVQG